VFVAVAAAAVLLVIRLLSSVSQVICWSDCTVDLLN